MPSPDCSTAIKSTQGWIFTARSSITATKITTSVGYSTLDLRLRHKTYHCVDFQLIYTAPLESSSSDPPRTAMCQSKIWQFFHTPHAPSVLLRSSHRRHHQNILSPIYIVGKESASSDSPRTLMHRPKLRQRLNHTPHAFHAPLGHLLMTSLPRQHPRKP